MKRRYTAEYALERVNLLKQRLPGLVLGADLMVGFPTESEQAFADTCELVRGLDIAFPHVFTYSARRGTPAARIPDQVPVRERKRRGEYLRQVGAEVRERLLEARIGGSARVLVEGSGRCPEGYLRARSPDYIPVYLPAGAGAPGNRLPVEYTGRLDDGLIARPRA
jgi:threonylcarbamoyladenosine tRNA methylthiotransferase MtaB